MAIFKRADLKAQGLTDEQIEFVMTEGNRSLATNYTLTSEVQGKIDAAVQAAQTAPADVTQSPEYQKVVNERDMLRAIGGEDFATVKPKFRETVFGMLDRSEKAPSVADQLKNIVFKLRILKHDQYLMQMDCTSSQIQWSSLHYGPDTPPSPQEAPTEAL